MRAVVQAVNMTSAVLCLAMIYYLGTFINHLLVIRVV